MKIRKILWIVLGTLLFMGCDRNMPIPLEGEYTLKAKTLTVFDLYPQQYNISPNVAEVVESKPEKLTIGFDLEKLHGYYFGSFKFGNNDQRTWFVMGKDAQGYWSEFYIDQNNDMIIREKEKVKSFQNGLDRIKGVDRAQSMSLIPVQIRVSYKGLSGKIEKNLYFFIITTVFSKKDASNILVEAITASFLEGEIKVSFRHNLKEMRFKLIDVNNNGCFNDYGTDLIFMDLNTDSYYHKKEGQKLVEFFGAPGAAIGQNQLRIVVPPYPVKMAIVRADQDFDLKELETISDQELNTEKEEPEENKESIP